MGPRFWGWAVLGRRTRGRRKGVRRASTPAAAMAARMPMSSLRRPPEGGGDGDAEACADRPGREGSGDAVRCGLLKAVGRDDGVEDPAAGDQAELQAHDEEETDGSRRDEGQSDRPSEAQDSSHEDHAGLPCSGDERASEA